VPEEPKVQKVHDRISSPLEFKGWQALDASPNPEQAAGERILRRPPGVDMPPVQSAAVRFPGRPLPQVGAGIQDEFRG
jgi:hypothetical protein